MTQSTTLGILFLAAVLEAGGDALVRSGLGASAGPLRWAFFVVGGLVLCGCARTGVVWFDAHGEATTPDTTRSGFLEKKSSYA